VEADIQSQDDNSNSNANVNDSEISCKYQSDCPEDTKCCNYRDGDKITKGTCWLAGSCPSYCETDANCSNLAVPGSKCIDGKCDGGPSLHI
jgi:hypothetical protein